MKTEEIVRSWRDDEYLMGLSKDEQALMPNNPAGLVELTDQELLGTEGGTFSWLGVSFTAGASLSNLFNCSYNGSGCTTIMFGSVCVG